MLNKYKPMLVPPRPWMSASKGGHLTLATPVVRLAAGSREQLRSLYAADAEMADQRGSGASVVCSAASAIPSHKRDPAAAVHQGGSWTLYALIRCVELHEPDHAEKGLSALRCNQVAVRPLIYA